MCSSCSLSARVRLAVAHLFLLASLPSLLSRLVITSKLWNTFHAREHVGPMIKKQLADWQIDYFDL